MSIPADLRYTSTHEWVRLESDGTATVGITHHAQELLGDIVFLELPDVGDEATAGTQCAVVESVKAASDIYAPITGEIIDSNTAAVDAPESVNQDAYATWLFKIKPASVADIDALLDANAYQKIVDAA